MHYEYDRKAVSALGLKLPKASRDLYTLSTTNWLPYVWSTNNVAHAEVTATAFAYFLADRPEEGFKILKADILDQMYLSPRSPYTTLSLPKQGVGEWCVPDETHEIEDDGFRARISDGMFDTGLGLSFLAAAENGLQLFDAVKATDKIIPGGAAQILRMPLDKHKKKESLTLEALSNDVVIGLMAVTIED